MGTTTVLNGTPWPLDRHGWQKLLGFEGIIDILAYDAGQITRDGRRDSGSMKLVERFLPSRDAVHSRT